jgi:hypothetical protein
MIGTKNRDKDNHPVAVVLASLDGRLVTGPEVLSPNTVHDLTVEVQCGPWPDWADRLDAELLTHLTPQDITTPAFIWHRYDHAGDGETYTQGGPLVLRFGLPAGQQAPPFLMRLTGRGERNGQRRSQRLDVTGHRQLRLRPFDATRDALTDYAVFDERLLALYERLAAAGYEHHQLQAFSRLLTAICRVGLRMTWDKDYRRGTYVTERKFHDDLHERLLAEPDLQGRLERGSPLALGYLDVRHEGITAELKVERKAPVTPETTPKYIGQPTQYAAADGARLSILTILDMSPKQLLIGAPENYLFTLERRLHGLDNPEAAERVMQNFDLVELWTKAGPVPWAPGNRTLHHRHHPPDHHGPGGRGTLISVPSTVALSGQAWSRLAGHSWTHLRLRRRDGAGPSQPSGGFLLSAWIPFPKTCMSVHLLAGSGDNPALGGFDEGFGRGGYARVLGHPLGQRALSMCLLDHENDPIRGTVSPVSFAHVRSGPGFIASSTGVLVPRGVWRRKRLGATSSTEGGTHAGNRLNRLAGRKLWGRRDGSKR